MRKRPIQRQRLSGFDRQKCLFRYSLSSAKYNLVKCANCIGVALPTRILAICLVSAPWLNCFADETNTPPVPAPAGELEQTNFNALLQNSTALMQAMAKLQAQVASQQEMLEQNLREVKEAAARNAEAVTNGLQRLEQSLAEQQQAFLARSAREVEALQSANRNMLIVVATFAATGFLAMLVTACFQWRMSKAWARISTALPMAWLGRNSSAAAVGEFDSAARIEDSNVRLLAAIERIEKRIQGLEQSSKPSLNL